MKLTVASTVGQNSSLEVRDDVFAVALNKPLISQAVRVFLSNQRQGTSKVKTRSEINRTKKKWFKQKGTGNARHGARTPNIFVGGGVAHGPTGEQNWNLSLSAAQRRSALTSALSAQVAQTLVTDDLLQLDGKTASAHRLLKKMLPNAEHVLVIVDERSPMVLRSLRNLVRVLVTTAAQVNTTDVVFADGIVMTKDAVKSLEARLGKSGERAEKVAAAPVKAVKAKSPAPAKTAKPVEKKVVVKPAEKSAAKVVAKKKAAK